MGFWQKVKGFFGIGGVKVTLEIPAEGKKEDGTLAGKITLLSKSDQHVLSLKVKMVEEYTTGRGDNKSTKNFDLGKLNVVKEKDAFDIKAGVEKVFEFELPYSLLKSKNDERKEKGGVSGALGKMGSLMDAEKSAYFVEADADIKGTGFDPSSRKPIKLV
jgi:SpoOM protein